MADIKTNKWSKSFAKIAGRCYPLVNHK